MYRYYSIILYTVKVSGLKAFCLVLWFGIKSSMQSCRVLWKCMTRYVIQHNSILFIFLFICFCFCFTHVSYKKKCINRHLKLFLKYRLHSVKNLGFWNFTASITNYYITFRWYLM